MNLHHAIRRSWKTIAVHCALGLALCGVAPAASYDAVTDFSLAGNPNGVWSYGTLSAYTGGTFSALTVAESDAEFSGEQVWSNGGSYPNRVGVVKNNTDTVETTGTPVTSPGLLRIDGENFIVGVRWTAPESGTYNVTGLFQRGDTSAAPVSVRIVQNGMTVLFSADKFTTNGSQQTFNLKTLNLSAGTTLDFAEGAGQPNNDGTGLAVTISTTTPNISAIHLVNSSAQDAKTVINGGSVFTTDFRGVNDVTITPLSGTTVGGAFADNFSGPDPVNNPSYLISYLGATANGTGDGSVGGIDLLEGQLTAPYSLQYDFKQPLTAQDRIIIADVDEGEKFQIKAYHLVNGSYVALDLTGWTHEQFSGQTGDVPDTTFAAWDPSTGTLTAGVGSGTDLNEPLDVFTPDQSVDRVVFNGLAANNSTEEIQVVEVPSQFPIITSAGTATAQVGKAFSYQIAATGSPTSYAVGGLVRGLSLNKTTGLISGTPVNAGTFTLTLVATNATGSGKKSLTLTIKPAVPVITSANSASATMGTAFSYQIKATGSPTSYAVGGLVRGLSINKTTGLISGTPTGAAGTYTLSLAATNAGGMGKLSLTLTIKAAAPVVDSPGTITATVGKAFSYQIKATNSPTSYAVGGLFHNLTINKQTGLISGTPATAGTYTLTLQAANAGGSGTAKLTVTVSNP